MISKAVCVVIFASMGMLVGIPLFAAEQTTRLPRIGVLWLGLVDPWIKAFHEGLRENGYVDGATAVIDIRAAGKNPELGPKLVGELVALDPDVIYAVPGVLAKEVVEAGRRVGKQIPTSRSLRIQSLKAW